MEYILKYPVNVAMKTITSCDDTTSVNCIFITPTAIHTKEIK